MASRAPTRAQIRQSHRQAVGGGRKRCRKGKNCSAACIQQGMICLVDLPESAGVATTKVRNMLQQRLSGKMPAPAAPTAASLKPDPAAQALKSQAKGVLRELKQPAFQGKTDAQKAGAEAKKARKQEALDKSTAKARQRLAEQIGGKKPEVKPEQLQPLRAAKVEPTASGPNQFRGRSEKLDVALDKLQNAISKLPPEQQAYWNQQVNEKLGMKGGVPTHRDGSPYTKAEIDKALTSQANGWTAMIKDGAPKVLADRANGAMPAPKNMIPDTTFTGQRKWISPEDGLVYSAPKSAAAKRDGIWSQNRASSKDTERHVANISDFRRTQKESGQQWPVQNLPPRPGLPRSVDEVIKGLTDKEKNAIVFNGLDASGNEGKKLRDWYNANPAQKEARLREVVQRWHDQGGRSGVSGQPVAIPGLAPKAGEARSSVDHFQPISTNRSAQLPAAQVRKIADNYKNFLVAEEGPNSNRGAKPWEEWLDKKEGKKDIKLSPKTTKALNEDQKEKVETAARMTNFRIDKRLNERQFYDDETNAKIKAQSQAVVAPYQQMKPNEKAALSLYGQDGVKYYQQVNQLLRTGKIEDSTPEKVKMAEFIGGNLKSGLEKLPPAKVEQLERAVSGNFVKQLGSLKPGDVIQDKGFGSYTDKGSPVLNQFIRSGEPNAVIQIRNPKTAREVAPVMEYAREGEHISMPGTRYRLVDVQEKGEWSRKLNDYVPKYTFEEVEG